MALSGTVSFNLTETQVIQSAYELLDVIAIGDPIPGELYDQARRVLNMMLKAWDADGLHLWKEYEGILFPVVGQKKYSLGPTGDRACLEDDYVRTAADGDQTVTTSLTVADASDIASGDVIGVVISNAINWTTVTGAPVANVVPITTLGGASVEDGATVVSYTSIIERPSRILGARRIIDGTNEAPINMISRKEYFNLTFKTSQGKVVNAYYDPKLTNGVLYVWPVFDSADDVVAFTFERQFMDTTDENNDIDIPQEWLEAVTWNLAGRLATYHHLPVDAANDIRAQAEQKKAELLGFDQEITGFQIQPYDDMRPR